jgi:chromosome partitioning protein
VPDDAELVGLFEIAKMAGVSPPAVANWRVRAKNFPKPVAQLKSGPVFHRHQVRRWLRKKKVPMATIVSTINLKGGVGKSTTTVALAEFLSGEFRKKVLVVDLDPQTNATVILIGEQKWLQLNKAGHTLAQLFKDAIEEDEPKRKFSLENTIQKQVSNVQYVPSVDLLPSSLDLIDIQDKLGSMSTGRFHSDVPTDILRRAVKPILDEYDYVLIDCPPNLGIITLNGLRISTGYIIPTIPDVLSTYGIPQIITRVKAFADRITEEIEPLGIVVSKYREQSTVHVNTTKRLRNDEDVPVFNTIIRENDQIAGSAEYVSASTLRQKYGYRGQFDMYRALTSEFIEATSVEVESA